MTRFVQADYPTEHAGAIRLERAADAIAQAVRSFDGARGGATFLLAASVSALLVVANQLIETWTDGHLLAAWVLMWLVAFAALALLPVPVRKVARNLRDGLRGLGAARVQAADAERLRDEVAADAQKMAEISRAMSRAAIRASLRESRSYY